MGHVMCSEFEDSVFMVLPPFPYGLEFCMPQCPSLPGLAQWSLTPALPMRVSIRGGVWRWQSLPHAGIAKVGLVDDLAEFSLLPTPDTGTELEHGGCWL